MKRFKPRLFYDRYGDLRMGWWISGALLVTVAIVAMILFFIALPLSRAGCEQQGHEYHLEAHYRFLSDTCYVRLPDGREIDVNQLRGIEPGRVR